MFRGSVRAAGIAALIGACVAHPALVFAGGHLRGWTPKKSQREMLHPNDCNFGYYGTAWRAWPVDCNNGYGCPTPFGPTMPPPMWSPSMAPVNNNPGHGWSIQPQSESPNPWSTLPPIPQTGPPPTWGPQLPPPTYGPAPTWSPTMPAAPQYPTQPFPTQSSPSLPQAPPVTQPLPNGTSPLGQRVPVPPMPTTMSPPSRGTTSAVVPAGGWTRSVPATLSAPDFGPLPVQPMSNSAPARINIPVRNIGMTVSKRLIEPSPKRSAPVTLLAPEF